jgi:uncharacterized protein
MAAASTDLVNCTRLAEDSAVLERDYELGELPRLRDLLAEPQGAVHATFAFSTSASGRAGAEVTVRAVPLLVCQRCMQGFGFALQSGSEVEFATGESAESADAERELFGVVDGLVSLRELAEEELLLALPRAFMCDTPLTCGRAPSYASGEQSRDAGEMRRPFSALQDLLKKT